MLVRISLFGAFALCLFAQGCQTPQVDHPEEAHQTRLLETPRNKGAMEKKFAELRRDMTKAEVDAILGPPTGSTRGGGSFSTCEQYCYAWRGDDGLIYITFAKDGAARNSYWGPPGSQDRIDSMNWQPEATQN